MGENRPRFGFGTVRHHSSNQPAPQSAFGNISNSWGTAEPSVYILYVADTPSLARHADPAWGRWSPSLGACVSEEYTRLIASCGRDVSAGWG